MKIVCCPVLSSISRHDTENLLIKPPECTLLVISTTYMLYHYILYITFKLYIALHYAVGQAGRLDPNGLKYFYLFYSF
jgi:hypothetical protein